MQADHGGVGVWWLSRWVMRGRNGWNHLNETSWSMDVKRKRLHHGGGGGRNLAFVMAGPLLMGVGRTVGPQVHGPRVNGGVFRALEMLTDALSSGLHSRTHGVGPAINIFLADTGSQPLTVELFKK